MTITQLRAEVHAWIGGLDDAVAEEGATDATLIASPLMALAHASVALVEQQRVSNRIAATALYGTSNPEAWPSEIREALA